MQQTFADVEENDHICLDIRTEPLFVERIESDGTEKRVFLTGKGTGQYQLTYDPSEDVCRFYRKRDDDEDDWTSPRFVHGLKITRKNSSKAELYI